MAVVCARFVLKTNVGVAVAISWCGVAPYHEMDRKKSSVGVCVCVCVGPYSKEILDHRCTTPRLYMQVVAGPLLHYTTTLHA